VRSLTLTTGEVPARLHAATVLRHLDIGANELALV